MRRDFPSRRLCLIQSSSRDTIKCTIGIRSGDGHCAKFFHTQIWKYSELFHLLSCRFYSTPSMRSQGAFTTEITIVYFIGSVERCMNGAIPDKSNPIF